MALDKVYPGLEFGEAKIPCSFVIISAVVIMYSVGLNSSQIVFTVEEDGNNVKV